MYLGKRKKCHDTVKDTPKAPSHDHSANLLKTKLRRLRLEFVTRTEELRQLRQPAWTEPALARQALANEPDHLRIGI